MYDVTITGKVSSEEDTAAVASRLAKLANVSLDSATNLLTRPVAIKRDVDEATAKRYQTALLKIGVQCQLRAKKPLAFDIPAETVLPAAAPTVKPAPSAPIALIYCYGCGVQIHAAASACPHCGALARDVSKFVLPRHEQPVAPPSVDNTLVWMLAFAPLAVWLITAVAAVVLYGGEVGLSNSPWFTPGYLFAIIAVQIGLCTADRKSLESAGADTSRFKDTWFVPVYLFKRAESLGQAKHYFVVWLVTIAIWTTGWSF